MIESAAGSGVEWKGAGLTMAPGHANKLLQLKFLHSILAFLALAPVRRLPVWGCRVVLFDFCICQACRGRFQRRHAFR